MFVAKHKYTDDSKYNVIIQRLLCAPVQTPDIPIYFVTALKCYYNNAQA